MANIRFILFSLVFSGLISCQSNQSPWKKATDYDFEFKTFRIENFKDSLIKEGDQVVFQYKMSLENGKILESSLPDKPVTIIVPAKMYINQFEAAFLNATSGDSLVVRYKKEKAQKLVEKHKNSIGVNDKYILLSYSISEVVRASRIKEMKDSVFSEKLQYKSSSDYRNEKEKVMNSAAEKSKTLKEKIDQKKSAKLLLENHNEFKIAVVEEGTGKKSSEGDIICFYYFAAIEKEAKIFDDNFKNGSRYCFKMNKDTKNTNILHRAVKDLQKGTKAYIFVPADLGYGKTGSPPVVPPNADLVLYVEIAELIPQK